MTNGAKILITIATIITLIIVVRAKISKQCNKILEEAEKKITILLEKDGEVKEENFVSEE